MSRGEFHFKEWQAVKGSSMWHYFKEGVSLCGRFTEMRILRTTLGMEERSACGNCEKALVAKGAKHGEG